jgi:hypothetical protein
MLEFRIGGSNERIMNRIGSRIGRVAVAFPLAACVGYVIAALFVTAANLIRLSAIGADISFGDAWRTAIFDLRGMAPSPRSWTNYGSLIVIGLAIAFPIAAWTRSRAARAKSIGLRIVPFLYPAAGATSIAVVLVSLYQRYEVVGIPGARGVLGFTAQLLAGALAGYLFQVTLSKSEN